MKQGWCSVLVGLHRLVLVLRLVRLRESQIHYGKLMFGRGPCSCGSSFVYVSWLFRHAPIDAGGFKA